MEKLNSGYVRVAFNDQWPYSTRLQIDTGKAHRDIYCLDQHHLLCDEPDNPVEGLFCV